MRQNWRLALCWRRPRTRSGSFTPGSSTRIRPSPSIFWILGETTPKRSIRVRSTLIEASEALSYFALRIFITSASVLRAEISSRRLPLPKTTASCPLGTRALYSATNLSIKSPECVLLTALSSAFKKLGSSFFPDKLRRRSLAFRRSTTFIPPLRSNPRPICCVRAFLRVYPNQTFSFAMESR